MWHGVRDTFFSCGLGFGPPYLYSSSFVCVIFLYVWVFTLPCARVVFARVNCWAHFLTAESCDNRWCNRNILRGWKRQKNMITENWGRIKSFFILIHLGTIAIKHYFFKVGSVPYNHLLHLLYASWVNIFYVLQSRKLFLPSAWYSNLQQVDGFYSKSLLGQRIPRGEQLVHCLLKQHRMAAWHLIILSFAGYNTEHL